MGVTPKDVRSGFLANMASDPSVVSLDSLLNDNKSLHAEVAELKLVVEALEARLDEIEAAA